MDENSGMRTYSLDGYTLDTLQSITPQPAPTSERIKELLSRALMKPETLAPKDIQAIAASVVYHLVVEARR